MKTTIEITQYGYDTHQMWQSENEITFSLAEIERQLDIELTDKELKFDIERVEISVILAKDTNDFENEFSEITEETDTQYHVTYTKYNEVQND